MRTFLDHSFKGLYYFFTDKNFRIFIWLTLRYGDKKRFVPTNSKVKGYRLHLPDGPSFVWQFYEIFFKRSYRFTTTKKQPVIFDCGANIGISCLFFKEEYPQAIIHAFEPDPTIFKVLSENLQRNQITDVQLYNAAVWKKEETLEFSSEGADGGALATGGTQTVKVKAIRLKDKIEAVGEIDLLKIDVEGAEVEVMRDCADALGKVQNIFVEYHSFNDQPQHLNEILEVLAKNGFRYYIENESSRKIPFVDKTGKYAMDMQINVFGYRV